MTIKDKFAAVQEAFGALKMLGRDPSTLQFDRILSPTEGVMDDRAMLLFGTNNYLGLTFDKACIRAANEATSRMGTGTTGSRVANGTYGTHNALEERVARFYGMRHAMVFSTGYLANLGTITGLVGRGDHLLIDADSHASIYDACRMSGAEIIRFRHNNPEDLAKKLKRLDGKTGDRLIITEGIYSMLGDVAPLSEIAAVKREAADNTYLLVDEAHSLGVLGENGRGKCEADGVMDDCDFIVGTFSKSIGTIGGYCVSDMEGFEALRSISRPYMFTASLSPGVAASALQAFDEIERKPELRRRLWDNASHLHGGLKALGFQLGADVSPVIAVRCPSKELAVVFWNALMDAGVYTNIAIPPATPNAISLLRVSVSAAHTRSQIETALDVFAVVGAQLGLIEATDTPHHSRPSLRIISGGASRAEVAIPPQVQPEEASAAAKP